MRIEGRRARTMRIRKVWYHEHLEGRNDNYYLPAAAEAERRAMMEERTFMAWYSVRRSFKQERRAFVIGR